jgi:hypothetical protein
VIDFIATELGVMLNKAATLDDSRAWFDAFTPRLKRLIINEWIQKDQLRKQGVDGNNEVIGFYSIATEFITNGRKQAGERFDLYDSGDFYESMFVTALNDGFIIDADTLKMEDQFWYDEDILKLTDENMDKLIFEIRKSYLAYVQRVLGFDL